VDEGGADAAPPDLTCFGPKGDGILTVRPELSAPMPALTAYSTGVFYYGDISGADPGMHLTKVSIADGSSSPVTDLPGGSMTLAALASVLSKWVIVYTDMTASPGVTKLVGEKGTVANLDSTTGNDVQDLLLTVEGGSVVAYVARTNMIERVSGVFDAAPEYKILYHTGGYGLTVDDSVLYVEEPSSILTYGRNAVPTTKALALARGASKKRLATSGGQKTAFAYGLPQGQPGTIARLNGVTFAPLTTIPDAVAVGELAANLTHLFWTQTDPVAKSMSISRFGVTGLTAPKQLLQGSTGEQISALNPVGSCLYYWSRTPNAQAQLRVIPDSPQ
jgi:hypothetical protein